MSAASVQGAAHPVQGPSHDYGDAFEKSVKFPKMSVHAEMVLLVSQEHTSPVAVNSEADGSEIM